LNRGIGAAFYGLSIFASGFAQVNVHIDEAGHNDEARASTSRRPFCAAGGDLGHAPIFDSEIGYFVQTLCRVDQPALTKYQLHGNLSRLSSALILNGLLPGKELPSEWPHQWPPDSG
jgi:hypothetical protein